MSPECRTKYPIVISIFPRLENPMKTIFGRTLTGLMCAGSLIAGTQTWAQDAPSATQSKTPATIVEKSDKQCPKPCKMMKKDQSKQAHEQHKMNGSMDMSNMDHSKMMNMDHSKMADMDHSQMDHSMMDMDHSKMPMPESTTK